MNLLLKTLACDCLVPAAAQPSTFIEAEGVPVSYDHTLLFKRIALALESDLCRSLGDLSRELQVSRRTIQNAVNVVTGKKFRELREDLLLTKIKKLLLSAANTTIRKVSLEAGYKSSRSFARAVRRVCGVTPHQLGSDRRRSI